MTKSISLVRHRTWSVAPFEKKIVLIISIVVSSFIFLHNDVMSAMGNVTAPLSGVSANSTTPTNCTPPLKIDA